MFIVYPHRNFRNAETKNKLPKWACVTPAQLNVFENVAKKSLPVQSQVLTEVSFEGLKKQPLYLCHLMYPSDPFPQDPELNDVSLKVPLVSAVSTSSSSLFSSSVSRLSLPSLS